MNTDVKIGYKVKLYNFFIRFVDCLEKSIENTFAKLGIFLWFETGIPLPK